MLANRGMKLAHFAEGISTIVDLALLEKADQIVDFDDLLSIAKRFNHAWPYLLVDKAEARVKGGHDNRTFLNQQRPISTEIVDQLEAAEGMLRAAADLFPEVVYEVPTEVITLKTPVAESSVVIRNLLGVSFDQQLGTHDDYAALRLWAAALQEHGVYVSQRHLDDPTIRAFSIAEGEYAVVVADTQDVPYARIFSLLHEYVHIVLRSTGICDLNDHTTVERFCNAVAAAVLMPGALLGRELPKHRFGASLTDDERVVFETARRLGVSQAALMIRLRDYGLLAQGDFDALESRRTERRGSERTGSVNYYDPAINRVGMRFARNVFRVLDAGNIDRQDAGVLLEVGEHLVDNYRKRLAKRSGGDV